MSRKEKKETRKEKKIRKDKRITKIYKAFYELAKDLYDLSEKKKHNGVCLTAKDMNEKFISDQLQNAKYGMYDVLSFLRKAEEENTNNALFS